jgi:uncharacterized protein DUF3313
MKTHTIFAAAMAALATTAFAAPQLQVEPGAHGFRKVLIEPVRVELHRDFVASTGAFRGQAQRLGDDEARRLAAEMGAAFNQALAQAFRARGYELATGPGADVLRISPALEDLYVNAVERTGVATLKQYVREAGQATMVAEGRDPKGARVVFATEQATAGRTEDFNRASDVSNRFWFEAMFRRWANELVLAMATGR